jgi:hypothetical protein
MVTDSPGTCSLVLSLRDVSQNALSWQPDGAAVFSALFTLTDTHIHTQLDSRCSCRSFATFSRTEVTFGKVAFPPYSGESDRLLGGCFVSGLVAGEQCYQRPVGTNSGDRDECDVPQNIEGNFTTACS